MDTHVHQLLSGSTSLVGKFQRESDVADINEAISLDRLALHLCRPDHPMLSVALGFLTGHLLDRYQLLGGVDDLNEAISLEEEALTPRTLDTDQLTLLNNHALHLITRYRQLGGMEDLRKAIILGRDVLALYPPDHPNRWTALTNLGYYLSIRYDSLGEIGDLVEAIDYSRGSLVLSPPGHPKRSTSLDNLATYLSTLYDMLRRINDLDEAIELSRSALALRQPGHPGRSMSLNSLACYLAARYKELGGISDLDEAIDLSKSGLALCPSEHPGHATILRNLASHFSARYDHLDEIHDLNEAIEYSRHALVFCPSGHPGWLMSGDKLARHLAIRYERQGGVSDLDEAIKLSSGALEVCPQEHPLRSALLNNFADHLSSRYRRIGGISDLTQAIELSRSALALRPPGHPDRSTSLCNLADYLSTRYERLGGISDLDEAIELSRSSLMLRPSGHAHRSISLNNLAVHIFTRYNQLGGISDLAEAIELSRGALALRPPGHPDRPTSLSNLALHLSTRHARLGEVSDLDEAIVLSRDALALRPPGNSRRSLSLNNLAAYLGVRYNKLGGSKDLTEAIVCTREALALCPRGHPQWSIVLRNLTDYLRIRFTDLGGVEDRDEVFSLYSQLEHVSHTVCSSDLSAAKVWINAAEDFHHPMRLLAYETALRLLAQHLTVLPSLPQHLPVLKSLTRSLAVDAFSACLRSQSPAKAVEFLEQGRSVFWNQLARLRSPLDDVIASGIVGKRLADEFTRLTSGIRSVLASPGPDQHNRVCVLSVELQGVVDNIRQLPGLSGFLLPPSFSDLRHAAIGGPIIVVNASRFSCDALVVFFERKPIHIPLPVTKEDVQELASKLCTLTKLAKSMDMTKDFYLFLRELWDKVVSHIIDFLQTTCPPQSRIWWCPTAEFSLLPFHAANPFRKGQKSVSDLYISSYTPTLTSLIRARRLGLPNPANQKKRFIAIGQAAASAANELLCVGTELTNIGQLVDGLTTFTRIEGAESCISRVADELSKNDWVHFACHGFANRKQPFESAFALHDGQFTIQHIIRCSLQDPEFAYLSACHTTTGDEESPDEMIHLASAMQFAGFRSVIGTMWSVDDAETKKVTTVFYGHMVDELGHLDYTRAAFALWKTMRTVKIPIDQRILYVHLGA